MISDYKDKSGAQKRKEEKETISKIRKTTHKIDPFFCCESYILSASQRSADFGLQDKASTVAEAPSESEITPHCAEPLDLSQPEETGLNGPSAKVSRPDSTTTSTQITPEKLRIFLNQIPAIMPLFYRCSGNFIQTSLWVTYHSIVL